MQGSQKEPCLPTQIGTKHIQLNHEKYCEHLSKSQIQPGLQSLSFCLLGALSLRDIKVDNSLFLPAVTLHAFSRYYFGLLSHSSSWNCPGGWESKYLQQLLDVLPMYCPAPCHAPVMQPCLLQAPHGWRASSQRAVCQLTQGFPWTGVRKPLCTLSIWSTWKEPYGSQTPQSDKHLHHGEKVAIFIFQSGEDEWYIQTGWRHASVTSHTPAPLSQHICQQQGRHGSTTFHPQQHRMPPFQGLPAHTPWLPSHVGLLLCPHCC